MEMYLPHGTQVFKTWVPEKMKNEDDHEDEEPEMKEEVPNPKTSLERIFEEAEQGRKKKYY